MNQKMKWCSWLFVVLISAGCTYTSTHGSCTISPGLAVPASIHSSPQMSAGTPSIEVPETVHDFGEVVGHDALAYTFAFKNNGSTVLQIKKILPS